MSSTDPCNCSQALAAEREVERLRLWLAVVLDEMDCVRDSRVQCMGPGYCPQATAGAALDGHWPLGMDPGED